jgi:hypothetical protein
MNISNEAPNEDDAPSLAFAAMCAMGLCILFVTACICAMAVAAR